VQLNAGQLQYIRLAQPVSGTQVVQGQIQTLATNAQQVCTLEIQSLSWRCAAAVQLLMGKEWSAHNFYQLILQQEHPPPYTHLCGIQGMDGSDGRIGFKMCLLPSCSQGAKELKQKPQGYLKDAPMCVCVCVCVCVRAHTHQAREA
jgi:hypothetical protein